MAVVVTGGTRGIGLEIAAALARPGFTVAVGYRQDAAVAESACARLAATGARPVAVAMDAGTAAGAEELVAAVPAGEPVDQLVHCAVEVVPGSVLESDGERFGHAVAVNGLGLLHLVRAALPRMARGGLVLFLTSRGGRVVIPGYASVGVGKALGEALVRYLAVDLAPRSVRVNALALGLLDTAAVRTFLGDRADAALEERAARSPAGRGLAHEDYLPLVSFLASPAAAMVTGQVLGVYGGADLLG